MIIIFKIFIHFFIKMGKLFVSIGEKNNLTQGGSMDTKAKIIEITIILVTLIGGAMLIFWLYITKDQRISEPKNMRVDTRSTTEEVIEEGVDLSERNIFFAGIEDASIRIGSVIALENLKENEDFLMKYTLYNEEDDLIYETDLIPAGQHVNWEPSVNLKPGEHKISFVEQPYLENEGEYIPLTSGRNIVNITILED